MTKSRPFSKVVLITDAGSAIGEAIARRLAMRGHPVMLGAPRIERVAALARDIAQAGGTATYQELDITSRGSVRAFLVITEGCHGRIDVLVNTSGMTTGIFAVLPLIRAQGVADVIHVPTDHALHASAMAEAIADAIDQPDRIDLGAIIGRPRAQA